MLSGALAETRLADGECDGTGVSGRVSEKMFIYGISATVFFLFSMQNV